MTLELKNGNCLELMKSIKTIVDCELFEASNGNEAIQVYTDVNPDMVFMDIVMPEKDGLEAVAEIRIMDQTAQIIMLSSVGTKENLQRALKSKGEKCHTIGTMGGKKLKIINNSFGSFKNWDHFQ